MGRALALLAAVALVAGSGAARTDEPQEAAVGAMGLAGGGALVMPPELYCLAQTIHFEAHRGSPEGQRAVGHVVLNRVADARFPNSICAVVRQGGTARFACQFHWYCDGLSDEPTDADSWRDAVTAAWAVFANPADDPTRGALFFHNDSVSPGWARRLERIGRIGWHTYYR